MKHKLRVYDTGALTRRMTLGLALVCGFSFAEAGPIEYENPVKEGLHSEVKGEKMRSISGTVTDDNSNPLPGVSVIIKGTQQGTNTNVDGKFTIEGPDSTFTLTFSFVGFQPQDFEVSDQTNVTVTLVPQDNSLEEVVVVGYGTQKRREINSAIASVKAENFNPGGVRSPLDLIQGKVAGLNVTRNSGNNPNRGAAVQMRGISSLSGSTAPLIVIDGIPGGNLDLLQQDDIESVDVLKDGSAAAIYGTRGNAGVILITTKKGKSGPPVYSYSSYIQREVVDRKPDYLSADQYRGLIDDGLLAPENDLGHSVDLYDELVNKKNLSQYHNFSASGGSAQTNYRASMYYNEANGIAKQNTRDQFGGRINVNQRGMQDRLSLQLNLAANLSRANLLGGGGDDENNNGDFEQAIQRNPTAPIIDDSTGRYFETTGYNNFNPIARLANRKSTRDQQTISADATLKYEIMKGLSLSAFGSYIRDNRNNRFYRSRNDWDSRPTTQWRGMGYASKDNRVNWTRTFESVLNYNTIIQNDHSIEALLGYSYQYSTLETYSVNNNGFTTDAFFDWNLGQGSAINNDLLPRPGMSSFKESNTLIAFFGRVNYAFANKYFVQGILRREGSSRFGANNKWGLFPAVSLGWMISEEDFLAGNSVINNLKLRAGYGVTGNQGIPNYQSLVTLSTGGLYPQENEYYQTFGASRNANPDLRWERKREWNFGADFGLFDNRITGSLDIYQRSTVDLLYNYTAQQPPFVRSSIFINVGSIKNHGAEIQLSGAIVQNGDFSWKADLAANSQFNRLTSLSNDVFKANFLEFAGLPSPGNLGNAIRLEEGGAVGNFYGKRFAGFDEDGRWLFYKADGSQATSDGMAPEDLTIIGNGVPKYIASLNNTFTYKNFDLSIFFRGKFAYDILNAKEMYFGNKKWLPNNVLESAIASSSDLNDDPQYSDYYIEPGGFVKLDNLTLGYSLNFGNSTLFKSLRVYAVARNLVTITKYSGIDPELRDIGFDTGIDSRGFYPRTKSFTLGLITNF